MNTMSVKRWNYFNIQVEKSIQDRVVGTKLLGLETSIGKNRNDMSCMSAIKLK